MDVRHPFCRSIITHWEHKKTRLTILKIFLTLILIFQPVIISHFEAYVPIPRVFSPLAGWAATWYPSMFILGIFSLVEYYLFSNPLLFFDQWTAYCVSGVREILLQTLIVTLILLLHPFHRAFLREFSERKLLENGCAACLTELTLLRIGAHYVIEIFATILSIATLWWISPEVVFLRSWKMACLYMFVRYAICMIVTVAATSLVWDAYCSGGGECYGNMGIAAWALARGPLGKIGSLGPWVNMMGREALREYPRRLEG